MLEIALEYTKKTIRKEKASPPITLQKARGATCFDPLLIISTCHYELLPSPFGKRLGVKLFLFYTFT